MPKAVAYHPRRANGYGAIIGYCIHTGAGMDAEFYPADEPPPGQWERTATGLYVRKDER